MSEADVVTGIPAIVNCIIMVPFSIFFHYAYGVGPYLVDRQQHRDHAPFYHGGPLGIRAFAGMFDPGELLGAIGFVFRMGKRGAPGKLGAAAAGGSARAFGTVASNESEGPGGHAYEMSRREQRRVGKLGRAGNSGGYQEA